MELPIYGITEEMRNLDILWEMAIDEETGEIMDGDVLEQLQNEIGIYLQNKSARIVKYYKSRDYFIDAVDQEIKKLQALKKASQNKQENFKKYIKMCMEKMRSEEHTSELQSRQYLVCRLLLEKKKKTNISVKPETHTK